MRNIRQLVHEHHARKGLTYLRLALARFQLAGSKLTMKRVRHAISSAKGAVRAGRYRDMRAERKAAA